MTDIRTQRWAPSGTRGEGKLYDGDRLVATYTRNKDGTFAVTPGETNAQVKPSKAQSTSRVQPAA